MLILAVIVIILTLIGYGVEGGFSGMIDDLQRQDPELTTPSIRNSALPLMVVHLRHRLCPYAARIASPLRQQIVGTKGSIAAVSVRQTRSPLWRYPRMLGLGGLLARVYFGDALYAEGGNPNQSLPLLFVEIFPTWLAALIGVGVLSAVMSTADGLVVSSSQIIANDLYRRSLAPKFHAHLSEEALDHRVLMISRYSTVASY